jgi:hypothetical protein
MRNLSGEPKEVSRFSQVSRRNPHALVRRDEEYLLREYFIQDN